MKTNKFAQLVKRGLSVKSLMTLTESEINTLHSLYEGKKEVCPKCGMTNCKCKETKKKETKEQGTGTKMIPVSQLPNKDQEKIIRKTLPASTTTDLGNNTRVTAGASPAEIQLIASGKEEEGKEPEMQEKKSNPWAICHSQVGPKKTRKFERCVRQVKKQMEENKLPFDKILENKILSLVEKHLKPKMKKGDLMSLISKKKMNLPIGKLGSLGIKEEEETKTKPKVKPGTKTPPKKKPLDPFKPSPSHNPAPRAKKSETKEAVMDAPAPTKKPKVEPGTKTPPKKKPMDPFRPSPSQQPAPRAKRKLPSWLKFNNLGIKFKK